MKTLDTCRVCGRPFFGEALLRYENMPKAAQFLPDAASLAQDKGFDLDVRQCSGCGLVQLSSEPVAYYREVIRAAGFSEEMKAFRMRQFQSFIGNHDLQKKKVIEIGCGRGEYLTLMQQAGADAYGLEYAGESVRECVNREMKVSQGFIESAATPLHSAPFDAFYILNFLEHLPCPNSILRGIYRNLADDAVGLVEVPNFDMILRNMLFSEFAADHLLYFTKDTLTTALRLNGFDVIECSEVWHDYILSAVVRKRKKTDLSPFSDQRSRLKHELEDYLRLFPKNKVAIWGAGHQTFAVIALADLAGKVRYVVDSAHFKQGKYTPATHVPIVPPEALVSDPVDAVIVMAASFSDEVANIIRLRFNKKMCVSVLRDYGLEVLRSSHAEPEA